MAEEKTLKVYANRIYEIIKVSKHLNIHNKPFFDLITKESGYCSYLVIYPSSYSSDVYKITNEQCVELEKIKMKIQRLKNKELRLIEQFEKYEPIELLKELQNNKIPIEGGNYKLKEDNK